MADYAGSLFDAAGPMKFAEQVHGIADALDSVNEKAATFFQTTQSGLQNMTNALSDFGGAAGGFGSGGRGGSGWSVGSPNSGGTGGQRGNTVGIGGSGNSPPPYNSMTGNAPNGGFSDVTAGRVGEAAVGVATGAAQRFQGATEVPSLQLGLAAQQGALMGGPSVSAGLRNVPNGNTLATSASDLALGTSAVQNLFGANSTSANFSSTGLGKTFNEIQLINPTATYAGAVQAVSSMNTNAAYRAQLTLLGTTARVGGVNQSPETLVNDLFAREPQLATMDNGSFEQDITNGNTYQNLLQITGGDANMLFTMQQLMRARRNTGNNSPLPTSMTSSQLRSAGLTYTPATRQLQTQSAKAHASLQGAAGQNAALSEFNRAMTDFYQAVNSIFGASPGTASALGFGSGLLSNIGGPVGTALGIGNGGSGQGQGTVFGGGGGGGGVGGIGGLLSLYGASKLLKGGLKGGGGLLSRLGGLFGGGGATEAAAGGAEQLSLDLGGAGLADAAGAATLGGMGAALAVPLAGAGAYYGTTKALDAIFGKPSSVKPSTSLTTQTKSALNFKVSNGVIDPSDRARLISEALNLANQPNTSMNANDVSIIIQNESGWSPGATNNWDSNAKAGQPSQGLMQLIPSTFNSNKDTHLASQDIKDPLANVVAGIKYAVSRYGSLDKVPGVQAVESGKKYVGYEAGSYEIEKTKLALLHKGERVVRSADNTVSARYGNAGSGGENHVHYHISSGAITVTMPGTDTITAQKTGAAIGDALMDRLSRA